MKKLELSKVAIKALERSIAHWEKDIIKPLREGRKVGLIDGWVKWRDTKEIIPYLDVHCPLCKLYMKSGSHEKCPYVLFYDHCCTNGGKGHWAKFDDAPSLRTAVAMKKSLERILNNRRKA